MRSGPGRRRSEDGDHAHLGRRADKVLVVTAEGIDGAGPDREDLAGFDDLDLAFAGDAIDGLEVVGVPDVGFGARLDHRVVQREAHPVALEQETTAGPVRSEEHTSELQSLMRISYAVFCLKKKKKNKRHIGQQNINIRTN